MFASLLSLVICVVHTPTIVCSSLAATESGGKHWQNFELPAVDGHVIEEHTALAHYVLDVPQDQLVRNVSAHPSQHDLKRRIMALECFA